MGPTSLKHRPTLFDWPLRKNGTIRKCMITFMVFSFVIIFFYYTQLNVSNFDKELVLNYSIAKSQDEYLIHTSKCRIPNDDPFNEEVRRFFHRESYVSCSKKPLLTYIEKKDSLATLHVNQSLLDAYSVLKVSCCYSNVFRIVDENKSDDEVRFSDCVPFEDSVNVTAPVIMVKCKSPLNSEIYSNVHAIVSSGHVVDKKIKRKWTSATTPLSVLFVGIDSISKMNLVRTMPKTNKFLEEHDFVNLKGYTKIADNTFPNLIAILTGKTWTQVYDYCNPDKNKLNNCDIIWDKFSDLGYITAYAEDESAIGTFNYNRKGFSSPPTDFYFRPYTIAAERLPSIRRFGMHTCSGPETSGERIMNLAKDFVVTFEDYPKFGLFWMNTFSHDNVNLPSSMDDKVKDFLKEVYPHLENTIFVFFSDHGFRFGKIRYTHTGWLEERLPFIYVHIPKTFKQRYAQEFNKFLINSKRLTTPFDLHMTLQDIISFTNQSYQVQPSLACPKCHSLFKEIDEARTCKDAAIEQHWCMCSGHSYINPNNALVLKTSEHIVSELNSLIQNSKEGSKCAFYYLKKVVSSGMSEKYLNEHNQTVSYLLIMLETRPSAMFEATVEVASQPDGMPRFRLLGDISRTNRYADNSKCIQNSLKKYCYCDGLFTSIKSAICNFFNCV